MIRLEARPYREKRISELKEDIAACKRQHGRSPGLRVIIVGENPASQLYVANKEKLAAEVGMNAATIRFPANAKPEEVQAAVEKLNRDTTVDGILIQRPLPKDFREEDVLLWVTPEKDVDAFHPETVGRMVLGLGGFAPCTPAGCLRLLDHYGYSVEGKIACVVGRSNIVGKPLAQLLLQRNATVLHCHSKTKDLASITKQADFLFVAVGQPHLVGASHVKNGAVVVDVGIAKDANGKTVGDVDYEGISKIAAAASPVPGGIGPMTILGLLENTLIAFRNRTRKK